MLVELEPNTLRNSRRHFLKWIPTAYKIDFGNSCKMTLRGIRKHERSRPFPVFIAELNYGRISRHLLNVLLQGWHEMLCWCIQEQNRIYMAHNKLILLTDFLASMCQVCLCMCLYSSMFREKTNKKNNKINVTEKALLLSDSSHR